MSTYDATKDLIAHPQNFGPGTWWVLSVQAAAANDIASILAWIKFFKRTIDTLPCQNCHEHATAYVKANPPEQKKYIEMTDPKEGRIGMAYYIWEFHNVVNKRLDNPLNPKPQFPWELFIPRYKYGEKACTLPVCESSEHDSDILTAVAPRSSPAVMTQVAQSTPPKSQAATPQSAQQTSVFTNTRKYVDDNNIAKIAYITHGGITRAIPNNNSNVSLADVSRTVLKPILVPLM
jgi:hypothetical protein